MVQGLLRLSMGSAHRQRHLLHTVVVNPRFALIATGIGTQLWRGITTVATLSFRPHCSLGDLDDAHGDLHGSYAALSSADASPEAAAELQDLEECLHACVSLHKQLGERVCLGRLSGAILASEKLADVLRSCGMVSHLPELLLQRDGDVSHGERDNDVVRSANSTTLPKSSPWVNKRG